MKYAFLLCLILLSSCVESRVKKYQALLEPERQRGKRSEIELQLGPANRCIPEGRYLRCEYLTAKASNVPVGSVYRKQPGMGPDLSPYDQFDVLHLLYDSFGVLQEWYPITIAP